MDEFVDAFIRISDGIANGSIGLLAFSVALNVYLFVELRRSQHALVASLERAIDKQEKLNAANAAAVEVMQSISTKLRR